MTTREGRFLFILILALGALDAWMGRHSYYEGDTVSYVDMAAGFAAGHFRQAVNEFWSPLYPLVLAAFIWPFEPDTFREFSAVRFADFLIFGFTLGAFDMFLRRFLDQYYRWLSACENSAPLLNHWQFTLAGYAAFLWATLGLNQPSRVNPDLGVVGVIFLLLAVLLSLIDGETAWVRFVFLGAVAGLGYWLKAILLPLALLLLLIAFLTPSLRRFRSRWAVAALVFSLIALPLVLAVSLKAQKLTISESSNLNYIWHVNRIPHWLHWQGGPSNNEIPIHPTRQIFKNPDAFEFGSPILATYAPWYDPYYWYEGAESRPDLSQQVHALGRNIYELARLLYHEVMFWVFSFTLLAIFLTHWDLDFFRQSVRRFAGLWMFAFGSIGFYLLVHVELRYLAAFLSLAIILVLALFRQSRPPSRSRSGVWVAALLFVGAILSFAPRLYSAGLWMIRNQGDMRRDDRWSVANEFARIGVPQGTPVGSIGEVWISDWARLARLRVVCEIARENHERIMGDTSAFWAAPPQRQQAVLDAFRKAGAQIVVANYVPAGANTTGWTHIKGSTYYYRFLIWPLPPPQGAQTAIP